MIAMSSAERRRVSRFVRRSSRAGPVYSTKLIARSRGTPCRRASARAPRGARRPRARWMRVTVGSPGTFSTRKWRSARLAICGRCVIVTTCARSASRRRLSPTACAVWPPMPASISSKTIVGPPATAAIASAIRESSPPEAVSCSGAGAHARVRLDQERDLVGAGRARLALREVDRERLADAHPAQLLGDGVGERAAAAAARASWSASWSSLNLPLGLGRAPLRRPRPGRRPPPAGPARRGPRPRGPAAPRSSRSGSGASRRRSARAPPRPARAAPARPPGCQEGPQVERRLAQPEPAVAQLLAGPTRAPGARLSSGADRALRPGDQPGRPVTLVRARAPRRPRRLPRRAR